MAKTVLTTDGVIGAYVAQDRPHAHEREWRIFFEGQTLYSYRRNYPIATYEPVVGRWLLLPKDRGVSLTTRRQITALYWQLLQAGEWERMIWTVGDMTYRAAIEHSASMAEEMERSANRRRSPARQREDRRAVDKWDRNAERARAALDGYESRLGGSPQSL